jgi:hypothetical protein
MPGRIAAVLFFLSTACAGKPDPLAAHRATCEQLQKSGQLKKGLALDACAQQLKAAADAADPRTHANEALDQLAAVVVKGRGSKDESQLAAVRAAVEAVQRLGRPAAPAALERMESSRDAEFRVAVAKALVNVCAADCGLADYSCIVPALLEGVSDDKPVEVRREAEKGLLRCTGQEIGDDPAAWKKWWAERKGRGASQAAR